MVKGWQYRWFVLEPDTGTLQYYLLDEKSGKCRGSQHLGGSVVNQSDEDGQTFTINFATGEVWKVRASHAKERQVWVDRLRACCETLSHHSLPPLRDHRPLTPPGSRSHFSNGEPSDQLQNLSLSVLDAFGSVHDILNKVDKQHNDITNMIEAFPAKKANDPANTISCHDPDLLKLKATSAATLRGLESTLSILKELRGHELGPPIVVHQSTPVPNAFSQSSIHLSYGKLDS